MRVINRTEWRVEDIAIPPEGLPEPPRYLVKSIKRYGVLCPIIIDPQGRVLAGLRRLRACRELGIEKIPVVVVEMEADNGEGASAFIPLIENCLRSDNDLAEVLAIKKLKDKGYTERDIAEKTDLPLVSIRKRLKPLECHPELVAYMEARRVEPAVLRQVVDEPILQEKVLELLNKGWMVGMDDLKKIKAEIGKEKVADEADPKEALKKDIKEWLADLVGIYGEPFVMEALRQVVGDLWGWEINERGGGK